jgi:Tfp pilus assembly protein PilF
LEWGHIRGFLYADLGESFLKIRLHTPDAIQAFENAVTLEPKNGDYHNALGLAHNQNGDPKSALKVFEKGLKTVGDHPEMLYNAACMQTKLGAFEEALSLLNRAVNLSPKLKELARQDPDLTPLRQRYARSKGAGPSEKKASPTRLSPAH